MTEESKRETDRIGQMLDDFCGRLQGERDDLRPARGILLGAAVGLAFWLAVALVLAW